MMMFNRDVTFYPPVTAQLPGANGYTGGKVIFIDTEVPIINIRRFFTLVLQ